MTSISTSVEKLWDHSALPVLEDYIRIPAISPGYEPDWEPLGHLNQVLELGKAWFESLDLERSSAEILTSPGRTPILLIEVGASLPDIKETTLFYGHMDKQPEAKGWDKNKGPWTPVMENNRLYGRGGGDDGYALFSALIALKSLQENKIPHGRSIILIETCEESGSFDLEYYLHAHEDRIPPPDLVICLDGCCADWERMWVITSLRGLIQAELSASLITQDIHSGNSGMVASSFRVLRQLLDRIECARTGHLKLDCLNPDIPVNRRNEAQLLADLLTDPVPDELCLHKGVRTMDKTARELLLNASWRPALSYTGAHGFPTPDRAANALRPETGLVLSFRTPPTTDAEKASRELKQILESKPPYGARTRFKIKGATSGWDMPEWKNNLKQRIEKAAQTCFDHPPCYQGQGGAIPFITQLSHRFPDAAVLITGVLGPNSNAHGPNEFLDIPYVKKLTRAVAKIMAHPPEN